MDILINFVIYLVAFALGALVVWLWARSAIRATSEDEAFAELGERGVSA